MCRIVRLLFRRSFVLKRLIRLHVVCIKSHEISFEKKNNMENAFVISLLVISLFTLFKVATCIVSMTIKLLINFPGSQDRRKKVIGFTCINDD